MRAGHLLVTAAASLWGTTGAVTVLAPDGASAVSVGAARIVLGGALLVLFAGRSLPALLTAGPRRTRTALLLGAAGAAVSQIAYFVAVDRTGVAVATVVTIGSAPVCAALLGLLEGEAPSRRQLGAGVLAVAGSALLIGGGAADGAGIVLSLVSGAFYAIHSVAVARIVRAGHDARPVAGAVFGLAAAVLLPVLAVSGPGWLGSLQGAAVAGYLGAVTTALAYVLYFRALRAVDATTATTLTLLEPTIAALLGLAVLHEPLAPAGCAGLVLVAASLALLLRR
ncbi:DMT family transporter [Actinocorallia aurea]